MVRRFPRSVTAAAILGLFVSAGGAEPALADQDDPRLEGLFRRLQSTSDAAEARVVEQRIWRVWLEAEDAGLNRLMHQGIAAMRDQRYDKALQVFDRMVEQAPEFAEGWNKRATVHFLMGNWRASVRDIQQTLALRDCRASFAMTKKALDLGAEAAGAALGRRVGGIRPAA